LKSFLPGHSAPSEAARTGTDGGTSLKASDCCITVCPDCHTRGPLAYYRIGKRAFERVFRLRCGSVTVARGGRGGWSGRVKDPD